MFEREFEFTVYHPLEVCEERILDLQRGGCFPPRLYIIKCDILPTSNPYIVDISVKKVASRGHNLAQIEATIEQIDVSTSTVSGIVFSKSLDNTIVVFVCLACGMAILATVNSIWNQMIIPFVFCLFWAIYFTIHGFYSCHHIVRMLDETLTQAKKKKV